MKKAAFRGKDRRKPVLIIQHAQHEHPAAVRRALEAQGIQTLWIHPYRGETYPTIDSIRGIISLGGPMGANDEDKHPWIAAECALLRRAVEKGLPTVGICLGGQMMARALGGRVEKNAVAEIGWFPIELNPRGREDPILGAAGTTPIVYHWHEDTFHLPEAAVLLAGSENCPRQAYRIGENSYGFQFHPEADHQLVHEWLHVDGTEEDIQHAQSKHGTATVQDPQVHRTLSFEGEKASLKITAALTQLFRVRDYEPVKSEFHNLVESLAAHRSLAAVEFEGPERKVIRLRGEILAMLSIPLGEFLIFKEVNTVLWPIRLDQVLSIGVAG